MERLKTPEELRLERVTKIVKRIKGFYKHLIVYLIVNAILIAVKYFDLEKGETFIEFSTFSTAFFWGIGLLFHAANVFRKNIFLGADWEEKKIREYMDQNQSSKWE
jgi:hypothetical protein